MLTVNEVAKPSLTSIVAIDAVLSDRLRLNAHPSESRPQVQVPPQWSQRFLRPVGDPAGRASTLDLLLSGMAGAGHGVAALSFYLGLDEAEVRERASSLRLADLKEKPLRRPTSANPWSVEHVRLLAVWLDNVSAASIAATLGRSPSSIHGKRRWLGLGVRDRKRLQERPIAQCRATALPWKPTFDVSAIVARLMSPRPGILTVVHKIGPPVQFPVEVKWALGRDKEKDERFSVLGFAGLRAPAIARRMLVEFGVRLTDSAVNNRISRLQIVRERRDMISECDEEALERRAAEAMKRLGATLRQCSELNRSFWWCKAKGGNRWTCREFETKKFQSRKAERSCGDVMAMA
jgi:hypothetical protein